MALSLSQTHTFQANYKYSTQSATHLQYCMYCKKIEQRFPHTLHHLFFSHAAYFSPPDHLSSLSYYAEHVIAKAENMIKSLLFF